MLFCWWLLLVALMATVCYCAEPRPHAKTVQDFKEEFKKFREQEPGPVQVSLLMNYLERYELYDEVDFASRDFSAKFARVRQILLKLDMIDERKIVQEVGIAEPVDEDSLRQKYSIPKIDKRWKHYRWKYFWKYVCTCSSFDDQYWSGPLQYLKAVVTSEQLQEDVLTDGHNLYEDFKVDLKFEQARLHVEEVSFPRVQQEIPNNIEPFLALLVRILKLCDEQRLYTPVLLPNKIKKYLKKLNLWSETHDKAWLDLLGHLIDGHTPEQMFSVNPTNVQIPQELSIFIKSQALVGFGYFLKIFAKKYRTVVRGQTQKPWNESIFLNKVHLMILWNVRSKFESAFKPTDPKLTSHNTETDNCVNSCVKYVVAPVGVIASLGVISKFAYNKLTYGQLFPFWPTQALTTVPWNTNITLATLSPTQESSGWTNWQVALFVVAIVAALLSIGLAFAIYCCFFQATNTFGKDTSGTTTEHTSSTLSTSSSVNKSCSKSTKKSSQASKSTLSMGSAGTANQKRRHL